MQFPSLYIWVDFWCSLFSEKGGDTFLELSCTLPPGAAGALLPCVCLPVLQPFLQTSRARAVSQVTLETKMAAFHLHFLRCWIVLPETAQRILVLLLQKLFCSQGWWVKLKSHLFSLFTLVALPSTFLSSALRIQHWPGANSPCSSVIVKWGFSQIKTEFAMLHYARNSYLSVQWN